MRQYICITVVKALLVLAVPAGVLVAAPSDVVDTERSTLETITRNEGKPEQAIEKIVEGRIGGFFKDVCLLEQPFAKDDKQSVQQVIGSAEVVRFAQVEIG